MEILLTAFFFGLIAGTLPGPILTSGFMTIVKNPQGFQKASFFPLIAGTTEIIIGSIMVKLGTLFFTNTLLFIITIAGIINIFWIIYTILKDRKNFCLFSEKNSSQQKEESYMAISYKEAFLLTLLNGPLYLFWISICIPLALDAEKITPHGGLLFVFSMVFGVAIMTWFLFYLMHISRKKFQNKNIMRVIPYVISAFFLFIGITMIESALEIFSRNFT